MLAKKNKYISSAYKQLKIISQDKEKRLEYEARQKAILDHNQFMYEAEQRGLEKGIEKGREEGRKEGMENAAKNLIALGLSTEIIAKGTGLSVETIDKMRNK